MVFLFTPFRLLNPVQIPSLDLSHLTFLYILNYVALSKHIFNLTLHYSTHCVSAGNLVYYVAYTIQFNTMLNPITPLHPNPHPYPSLLCVPAEGRVVPIVILLKGRGQPLGSKIFDGQIRKTRIVILLPQYLMRKWKIKKNPRQDGGDATGSKTTNVSLC